MTRSFGDYTLNKCRWPPPKNGFGSLFSFSIGWYLSFFRETLKTQQLQPRSCFKTCAKGTRQVMITPFPGMNPTHHENPGKISYHPNPKSWSLFRIPPAHRSWILGSMALRRVREHSRKLLEGHEASLCAPGDFLQAWSGTGGVGVMTDVWKGDTNYIYVQKIYQLTWVGVWFFKS